MNRLLKLSGIGLALVSISAGILYLRKGQGPEGLLVIKAESGPYKVRPDNFGQSTVANHDKMVYERLTPEKEEPRVEKLLTPIPETVDLEEVSAAPIATEAPQVAEVSPSKAPVEPSPQVRSIEDLIALNDTTAIQIAQLPTKAEAEKEWKRLKTKVSALEHLSPRYQSTSEGVQVILDDLPSLPEAKALCDSINTNKGKCLVLP